MISSLSEQAQIVHSFSKIQNWQAAKIWSLQLKKQKNGATILFPEGLKNTPFKKNSTIQVMPTLIFSFLVEDSSDLLLRWLLEPVFDCGFSLSIIVELL